MITSVCLGWCWEFEWAFFFKQSSLPLSLSLSLSLLTLSLSLSLSYPLFSSFLFFSLSLIPSLIFSFSLSLSLSRTFPVSLYIFQIILLFCVLLSVWHNYVMSCFIILRASWPPFVLVNWHNAWLLNSLLDINVRKGKIHHPITGGGGGR